MPILLYGHSTHTKKAIKRCEKLGVTQVQVAKELGISAHKLLIGKGSSLVYLTKNLFLIF